MISANGMCMRKLTVHSHLPIALQVGLVLTALSFSRGISNAHLNFESISSSGFASFHCGQHHRKVKRQTEEKVTVHTGMRQHLSCKEKSVIKKHYKSYGSLKNSVRCMALSPWFCTLNAKIQEFSCS